MDRFTPLVHRFDRFLESCRRASDAELAIRVYYHLGSAHRNTRNTGNKGAIMCPFGADPNLAGFATYASIAYVDVTAACDCGTSINTYCDIETTALIVV